MNTLIILGIVFSSIMIYTIIGVITKSYVKVYRGWVRDSDLVLIGIFWPIYWLYRLFMLIFCPAIQFCGSTSDFIENKMIDRKTKLSSQEIKKADVWFAADGIRADFKVDPVMQEAEQEVEDLLTKDEYRSL